MLNYFNRLFLIALIIPSLLLGFSSDDRKTVFTYYFDQNIWGGISKSGTGSDLDQTAVIRKVLPDLLKQINCNILIDAPCGDLYWIKTIDLPIKKYIGIDIVDDLIIQNRMLFNDEKFTFYSQDLVEKQIPYADLILSRDCLVHLSFNDIKKVINNFKRSGSLYLLTTSFVKQTYNFDIPTGFWHPINLQKEPFNFPNALLVIDEKCTEEEGKWSDKSLLLWDLSTLPYFEID